MRLLALLIALSACPSVEEPVDDPTPAGPWDVAVGPYDVEVRWTEYGVPHLLADDLGSAAYGMGWAQARDHICTLMDQVVMVRSERARYFGRGEGDRHVDSDFGWKALDVMGHAERGFLGLVPEGQAALVGFAAGVDRYLEEVGAQGLPEPCRGAEWVQPITHIDLLAYAVAVAEFGSGGVVREAIAQAQPPGQMRSTPTLTLEAIRARLADNPMGSNGWAIGDERSQGGGLLLSNTHFPHFGERRWWEAHLRVPGVLDAYGAALIGLPVINLGFNQRVAWTHTVSGAPRFTAYRLRLDPEDPTRYLRDGEYVAMTSTDHRIDVRQEDGSIVSEERTLWRSHHGPIITFDPAIWTPGVAYAIRDANEGNLATVDTWLGMNQAADLDDLEDAMAQAQGIPWVHTLATDASGEVLYVDAAATPNLSPAAEAAYDAWLADSSLARQALAAGLYLFDGSDPVFDWVEVGGTRLPGLIPYDGAPRQRRRDFVANANDNHWLSNPAAPIVGASWVYGAEGTPRSARTRMNLRYLQAGDPASGADERFDLGELMGAALSARGWLAEELADDVVLRCQAMGDAVVNDVAIAPACAVLAGWDRSATTGAVGAVLWREFVAADVWAEGDSSLMWATPFDPDQAATTPRGLAAAPAAGEDPVGLALAEAVGRMEAAGLALDVALGDAQYAPKDGTRVPMPGGSGREGLIAIATTSDGDGTLLPRPAERALPLVHGRTGLREGGYPVGYGNSYVLAVQMDGDGPVGRAVMTYSQSADPDSPHYHDQTTLYGAGGSRAVRWTEEDIAADPALVIDRLTHPGG